MIASSRQRAAVLGEPLAVPRISDLAISTRHRWETRSRSDGSHQMSERQVLDSLIALRSKMSPTVRRRVWFGGNRRIFSKGVRGRSWRYVAERTVR